MPAGFPAPNEGDIEEKLDLNEHLIRHKAATFYVRVEGTSMKDEGIHPGDLLIIDRAETARHGSIVLAVLNGEFTVKRLFKREGVVRLDPANPDFSPITLSEEDDFCIWGVVTYVVHKCMA